MRSDPPKSMWDDEAENPWLIPLYLAAVLVTVLGSHIFARLAS